MNKKEFLVVRFLVICVNVFFLTLTASKTTGEKVGTR